MAANLVDSTIEIADGFASEVILLLIVHNDILKIRIDIRSYFGSS